jgi:sugar phosphate isomerase/epimerase
MRNTLLGAGSVAWISSIAKASPPSFPERGKDQGYTLGIADYTFRHFDIPQSIAMMQDLAITNLTIKDFHMPLDSSPEKIKEIIAQYTTGGIHVYGVGVIYMKTQADVDRAFDYAKNAGVSLIVGVPEYELLDYTEQKVKQYGIRLAIHNHGPQDKLYPGPAEVYEKIKNRDARMGLCLDVGHSIRAGEDPAKAVLSYSKRLFDMHIKDVTKAENSGEAIEIGRGVVNFQALVKALRKVGYAGHCSIEFEKNISDKNLEFPGIAECIGYYKGVSETIV